MSKAYGRANDVCVTSLNPGQGHCVCVLFISEIDSPQWFAGVYLGELRLSNLSFLASFKPPAKYIAMAGLQGGR